MLNGFAADLGGTKIAAARVEKGVVASRLLAPTQSSADAQTQLGTIAGLLARLGYESGAPLGLAVAGRVDAGGHWHAVNRGTLSAIDGVPLATLAARILGPATCLNDAAAAALAEARYGTGHGSDSFAYLTISTGVGGGLVSGGHLLRSANGLAGHVGFASSRFADVACESGRSGTVESVAGGRAIAAAGHAVGHSVDARMVFDAAAAGAPWAERIVARSASAVAALIADLAAILGVDTVAIGGSIGMAPGYLDRVRIALDTEPNLFRPAVALAVLGHDAPLIGALAAHLEGDAR